MHDPCAVQPDARSALLVVGHGGAAVLSQKADLAQVQVDDLVVGSEFENGVEVALGVRQAISCECVEREIFQRRDERAVDPKRFAKPGVSGVESARGRQGDAQEIQSLQITRLGLHERLEQADRCRDVLPGQVRRGTVIRRGPAARIRGLSVQRRCQRDDRKRDGEHQKTHDRRG